MNVWDGESMRIERRVRVVPTRMQSEKDFVVHVKFTLTLSLISTQTYPYPKHNRDGFVNSERGD